jgi:hypothetical protein
MLFTLALVVVMPVCAADVNLPDGTQITLQLNDTLSTASNMEGDKFTAVVAMPVYLGDRIVIPKGSLVTGSVSRILRPGRLKGKAVLDLMFQTIKVPGRKAADLDATLIWLDPEGSDGIQIEVGGQGGGKSAAKVSPSKLPKVSGRALTQGGGSVGIASGGRPSVFNSKGDELEIHRGATLDILLDHPLVLSDE